MAVARASAKLVPTFKTPMLARPTAAHQKPFVFRTARPERGGRRREKAGGERDVAHVHGHAEEPPEGGRHPEQDAEGDVPGEARDVLAEPVRRRARPAAAEGDPQASVRGEAPLEVVEHEPVVGPAGHEAREEEQQTPVSAA